MNSKVVNVPSEQDPIARRKGILLDPFVVEGIHSPQQCLEEVISIRCWQVQIHQVHQGLAFHVELQT